MQIKFCVRSKYYVFTHFFYTHSVIDYTVKYLNDIVIQKQNIMYNTVIFHSRGLVIIIAYIYKYRSTARAKRDSFTLAVKV